jgi:hypothetical protein
LLLLLQKNYHLRADTDINFYGNMVILKQSNDLQKSTIFYKLKNRPERRFKRADSYLMEWKPQPQQGALKEHPG